MVISGGSILFSLVQYHSCGCLMTDLSLMKTGPSRKSDVGFTELEISIIHVKDNLLVTGEFQGELEFVR